MEKNGIIPLGNCFIRETASTVGKNERLGPLHAWFDATEEDEYFGKPTFEQAESELVRQNLGMLFRKAGIEDDLPEVILGGDLINQCTGTSFGIGGFGVPFFGLYGACSTIAEGLLLGSILVDSGKFGSACAVASSHFCTAERQYRFPPEYGSQRPPMAQNTVTGAGAFLLTAQKTDVRVSEGIVGKIVDGGITDPGNMGAAMAPVDVIIRPYPIRKDDMQIKHFTK